MSDGYTTVGPPHLLRLSINLFLCGESPQHMSKPPLGSRASMRCLGDSTGSGSWVRRLHGRGSTSKTSWLWWPFAREEDGLHGSASILSSFRRSRLLGPAGSRRGSNSLGGLPSAQRHRPTMVTRTSRDDALVDWMSASGPAYCGGVGHDRRGNETGRVIGVGLAAEPSGDDEQRVDCKT
jgi:hypothetical protein